MKSLSLSSFASRLTTSMRGADFMGTSIFRVFEDRA
jgi:hypothetical protein